MRMGLLAGEMGSTVPELGGHWVSLAPQARVLAGVGGWMGLPHRGSTALGSVWLVCAPCLGPHRSNPGAQGSRAGHWVPALP